MVNQLQVFLDAKFLTKERIITNITEGTLNSMDSETSIGKNQDNQRQLRLIGQIRKKIILNNIVHENGEKWLEMNQFQTTNWEFFDKEYPSTNLKRKFDFENCRSNRTEPQIRKRPKSGKNSQNNLIKTKDINWDDHKMDTTFFDSFVLDSSIETENETICISDSDDGPELQTLIEESIRNSSIKPKSPTIPTGKKIGSCQTTGKYTTIASNSDQIIQELIQIIKAQNENHQRAMHNILTHTSIGLEAVKKFMHYGILQV